ncbi:MAG: response regulator [Chitinophagales bacterium]
MKKRNKVLILDDEKELCALVKEILKPEQYQVDCAYTLKEGMKKWGSHHPSVVLLDNNLPDGLGLDMIETHQSLLEDSQVIMITADIYASMRLRAEAAGIHNFLEKPFSLKTIREMVNRLFDR